MTLNKFQRLFLRQYRELHESKSRKRVLLIRIVRSFLGSVIIAAVGGALLYFMDEGAFRMFPALGAGILLGVLASQLGDLMRRLMAWDVVEEITDWPKAYKLLGDSAQDGRN